MTNEIISEWSTVLKPKKIVGYFQIGQTLEELANEGLIPKFDFDKHFEMVIYIVQNRDTVGIDIYGGRCAQVGTSRTSKCIWLYCSI